MKYLIGAILMLSLLLNLFFIKSAHKYQIEIHDEKGNLAPLSGVITFYSFSPPKIGAVVDSSLFQLTDGEFFTDQRFYVMVDSSYEFNIKKME